MMNLLKMFKKKPRISDFVHDEPVNEPDVGHDAGSETVLIDETTFVGNKKDSKLKVKKERQSKVDAGIRYVIDCRIESGTHLYFEVMSDGNVTQVSEPSGNDNKTIVVSTTYQQPGRPDDDTAEDYRFNLPKKMMATEASQFVQRELGLLIRLRSVIGHYDNTPVAYSVSTSKLKKFLHVMPFAYTVENLLMQNNNLMPCVTGILFGETSLLILMAYPGNGRVFVQTAVSPDNLQEIIGSFISASSVIVDLESVIIFSGSEFFAALSNTPKYPLHNDIYGISFPMMANYAFIGSLLCAFFSLGFYGVESISGKNAQKDIAVLTDKKTNALNDIAARIGSNEPAFVEAISLHTDRLYLHARKLWVDGSTVKSEIDFTQEIHKVILPTKINNRLISQEQIDNILHKKHIPSGCVISNSVISSALEKIEVDYSCSSPQNVAQAMDLADLNGRLNEENR